MNIGLLRLGIEVGSRPEMIRAIAQSAEKAGISTLWAPEHVVLFERHDSKYPYSESGRFPMPAQAPWLDPFIALTFAAAITSKIRLGTGICLVPEHNPLVLAKEIASVDRLANGRFALGVGIGWSAEEFAAIGIPFERRAQRAREHIEAMRRLWGDGFASYHGEFVNFDNAGCFPKPSQGSKLPVIFGGESTPALQRVAEYGDGWYGFDLDPERAKERVAKLEHLLKERNRKLDDLDLIVSPYSHRITVDDLKRYRDLGFREVVLLYDFAPDPAQVPGQMEQLARAWVEPAAKL